jgi:hypothetical protein
MYEKIKPSSHKLVQKAGGELYGLAATYMWLILLGLSIGGITYGCEWLFGGEREGTVKAEGCYDSSSKQRPRNAGK